MTSAVAGAGRAAAGTGGAAGASGSSRAAASSATSSDAAVIVDAARRQARAPRRRRETPADSVAGVILAFLFWTWVALPMLRGGPDEVRAMIRAKFVNKDEAGRWLP